MPDSRHDRIEGLPVVDATYTSVFDGGAVVCTSKCKYDPNACRVFDIETADNAEAADNADCRTDEYVTLPDGTVLRDADSDVTFDY